MRMLSRVLLTRVSKIKKNIDFFKSCDTLKKQKKKKTNKKNKQKFYKL